jgi:hypothetical protein
MADDQNRATTAGHPATPRNPEPQPNHMINLGYVALLRRARGEESSWVGDGVLEVHAARKMEVLWALLLFPWVV